MTQKAPEPVAYASEKQLRNLICDRNDDSGVYIPLRQTAGGLFQMPLYTTPSEAIERCAKLVENWKGSIPARQVLVELIRESSAAPHLRTEPATPRSQP